MLLLLINTSNRLVWVNHHLDKQQAYPRVGVLLEEVQYKKYENIDYEPDTKDIMIH